MLLPVAQYGLIASTPRSANTDTTIITYLQANNIYTSTTGRPLTIRTLRQLTGAGAGGTNRMITYRRDPQVLKFHMPMPHQFFPALCRERILPSSVMQIRRDLYSASREGLYPDESDFSQIRA